MKRADENAVRPEELVGDGDASDLSPNDQAVLSQQTAPNRTPSDKVQDLRGDDSLGPGDQPNPASGKDGTGAPGDSSSASQPLNTAAQHGGQLRKTSDPAGADS